MKNNQLCQPDTMVKWHTGKCLLFCKCRCHLVMCASAKICISFYILLNIVMSDIKKYTSVFPTVLQMFLRLNWCSYGCLDMSYSSYTWYTSWYTWFLGISNLYRPSTEPMKILFCSWHCIPVFKCFIPVIVLCLIWLIWSTSTGQMGSLFGHMGIVWCLKEAYTIILYDAAEISKHT